MPRRDSTGPLGQGEMTGRGLGTCNTLNVSFGGFGQSRSRGQGRGFNRLNSKTKVSNVTPSLKLEKEILQERLDTINKQLEKQKG